MRGTLAASLLFASFALAGPSGAQPPGGSPPGKAQRTVPPGGGRPSGARAAAPSEANVGGPLAQPQPLDQPGFPADLYKQVVPADNPQTAEKVALGQKLFFDQRLSADGSTSCSTCHDPAK